MLVVLEHRDALKAVGRAHSGPGRQLDDGRRPRSSALLGPLCARRRGAAALPRPSVAMSAARHPLADRPRRGGRRPKATRSRGSRRHPSRVVIDLVVADVERDLIAGRGRAPGPGRRPRSPARRATSPMASAPWSPTSRWRRSLPLARRLGATALAHGPAPAARDGDPAGARPAHPQGPRRAARRAGRDARRARGRRHRGRARHPRVAKSHAAELALNEVTLRVFSDLQGFLDAGVNPLLDGLRGMAGEDRAFAPAAARRRGQDRPAHPRRELCARSSPRPSTSRPASAGLRQRAPETGRGLSSTPAQMRRDSRTYPDGDTIRSAIMAGPRQVAALPGRHAAVDRSRADDRRRRPGGALAAGAAPRPARDG